MARWIYVDGEPFEDLDLALCGLGGTYLLEIPQLENGVAHPLGIRCSRRTQ